MSLSPFENGPQRSHRPDGPTVPYVAPARRRRAARDAADLPVSTDGWSTCPSCLRTWQVTAKDDVLLPSCGCLGTDWSEANRWRSCLTCGLKHEQDCEDCEDADGDTLPVWSPGAPHTFGKGLT
jgi:hypothetical protein